MGRALLTICLILLPACADEGSGRPGATTTQSGGPSAGTATAASDTSGTTGTSEGSGSAGTSAGSGHTPDAGDTAGTSGGTSGGDTSGGSTSGGGNGVCEPSMGAGGMKGLQSLTAPSYPQIPASLYVPSSYDDADPIPLLVALHGSGDTAANFMGLWQSVAETYGFIVLVPESVSNGASWNTGTDPPVWVELFDALDASYNIDKCRVYLTGFSAGAHVTYYIGLYNTDYFAGLGAQAGSIKLAEQDGIWPDEVTRKIAVDIRHGEDDPGVPVSEATYARDQLQAKGHPVYLTTHPGGHTVFAGDPEGMWMNLSQHTLDE